MSHNNDKSTFFHRPITTSQRELLVSNYLVENMNASRKDAARGDRIHEICTFENKYSKNNISCVIICYFKTT